MNELTYDILKMLRKKLELVWDEQTSHEQYQGKKGLSVGQCYVSTLVAYLYLEKYNPKVMKGDIGKGDFDHYWLEINGKIVDLTADQYNELKLPPIVFGSYEEYNNYIIEHEDTGFKRFLILLRRFHEMEMVFGNNLYRPPKPFTELG